MTDSLSWTEICDGLGKKSFLDKEIVECNIVETSLFVGGEIKSHLISDNGRVILAERCTNFADKIIAFAEKLQPNGFRFVAILHSYDKPDIDLISEEDLISKLDDKVEKMNIKCIQNFIPSKGNGSIYRTYNCTLNFSQIDRSYMTRVEKLGVSLGISGSIHINSSLSMDKVANEKMERMCSNLCVAIQRIYAHYIQLISADFVQDVFGTLWLLHTCECRLAGPTTKFKRAKSPNFKYIRNSRIFDDGVKDNTEADKSKQLNSLSIRRSVRLTPMQSMSPAVGSGEISSFGSSQLSGCPGDFCQFEVGFIEEQSLIGSVRARKSDNKSDLRKKLEKAVNFEANNIRKLDNDVGVLLNSKLKGHPSHSRSKLSDASISAHSKSALKDSCRLISYNAIVEARNEMSLVKLLLLRHRNGESADYYTTDTYEDIAAGTKLPSKFYEQVSCCESCYKVYQLVEVARSKALIKLGKIHPRPISPKKSLKQSTAIQINSSLNAQSIDSVTRIRNNRQGAEIIDSVTKLDVAEIRTMSRPPAAVVVVLEALTAILTGKIMTFQDTRRLIGSGDAFLEQIKNYDVSSLDDSRLNLVKPYVDNPIFKPENVVDVSKCASKLCSWILATTEAARAQRIDAEFSAQFPVVESSLTFKEKLERRKAREKAPATPEANQISPAPMKLMPSRPTIPVRLSELFDVGPNVNENDKRTAKEKRATKDAQAKSADRLSSHLKESKVPCGPVKEFVCSDGVTMMPFMVLGDYSPDSLCCNFVVVHDFFDTFDSVSILLKPIVTRHPHCQILCFNYPGQANTQFPSAPDVLLNNDWIADRIHELLQYTESTNNFVLFSPFHLVGIGNGGCIASSFVQRWGSTEFYAGFLRSLVSINGFLSVDSQLLRTLSSAVQVFESSPAPRPDIPVSFWAKFMFSEEYLTRVKPKLALNIYTAVLNPISIEGRLKITNGALNHRDIRGGLSPEKIRGNYAADSLVRIPIILLQSTENTLVNASNVDSFLVGRHARHLWSHQQNPVSDLIINNAIDTLSLPWVGSLSEKPETYSKCSVLGKGGLRMILDTLKNYKGAFVMWSRSGHCIQQESKQSFLDLMDALSCPTEEYFGLPKAETLIRPQIKVDLTSNLAPSVDILFTLESSNREVDPSLLTEPVRVKSSKSSESTKIVVPEPVLFNTETGGDDIIQSAESYHEEEIPRDELDEVSSALIRGTFKNLSDHEEVFGIDLDQSGNAITQMLIDEASEKDDVTEPIKEIDAIIRYEISEIDRISTKTQRDKREWTDVVPSVDSSLALEAQLRRQEASFYEIEERIQQNIDKQKMNGEEEWDEEQANRRREYSMEDNELLLQLKRDLERRRIEREEAEVQRRLQMQAVEKELVRSGLLEPYIAPIEGEAVIEMAPIEYDYPMELPSNIVNVNTSDLLDSLVSVAEEAKALGIDYIEDFERVKRRMAQNQIQRDQRLRNLTAEEQEVLYNDCARMIQRRVRGVLGRKRYARLKLLHEQELAVGKGLTIFQSLVRRRLAKKRVQLLRFIKFENMRSGRSTLLIQSVFRGYQARRQVRALRREIASLHIQKVFRGWVGRNAAAKERERLLYLKRKHNAATLIQSCWRMKVAKEEYRSIRIHSLAAIEIQRSFRGYIGRKIAKRRRNWESATPGPERIKLGLSLIEESRIAFERQQEELDAIHRAQERAEERVSHIHSDLRESEKELLILERELLEIDQIERELINLTHEKELLNKGISEAAGISGSVPPGTDVAIYGKEYIRSYDPEEERKNKAEAFALEMTIQIKRAEREKKRQELETEFALVFQEVEKKKQALDRLELSLADMEATRERKDREFRRLQSNLMQLLMEQKQELDSLREKGIELETATALTASAAVATANKAMEHEKRSTTMFSQTEELMKFQFMSMSLSYFSSLNMLKQLKDMNADTTSSAVSSSANAAAAAAASSIAANLPNIQKLDIGANDFIELSIQKKRAELAAANHAEKEAKKFQATPMPDSIQLWTVSDVARWLESLLLSEYAEAFKEARIDGPFLMELREEDMVEVLGITHKLHVRKIIVSRDKLRPLSEREFSMISAVEREDMANAIRTGASRPVTGQGGVPDTDAVFSQCRNGHIKRVEEAINLGFKVDTEDEKGNTLLLVAAQNSNKRLVELLLFRGASINHQNAQGNTALHFALTYDSEGSLGEYLIEHGANDMLENIHGLTPYDGVG